MHVDVLLRFIEWFPKVIVIVGVSGIFGLSMILALLSDLTSLMSMHITLAYRLIRIGYRSQLLLAKSLFNLFRGMWRMTLQPADSYLVN